jgi:hypothetical protein
MTPARQALERLEPGDPRGMGTLEPRHANQSRATSRVL